MAIISSRILLRGIKIQKCTCARGLYSIPPRHFGCRFHSNTTTNKKTKRQKKQNSKTTYDIASHRSRPQTGKTARIGQPAQHNETRRDETAVWRHSSSPHRHAPARSPSPCVQSCTRAHATYDFLPTATAPQSRLLLPGPTTKYRPPSDPQPE